MGRNAIHPGILDAEFLLEQRDLMLQPIDLSPEPGPAVPVVRGAGDHGGEGVVAEGQDVEDRRLRPPVPAARQGDLAVHQGLREDSLVETITEIIN
jgi:hypothetical protein